MLSDEPPDARVYLSRIDIDLLSIDRPSQHAVNAVDRPFVVVVDMRWSWQSLRTRKR
jgi:hypothetical protein